VLSRIVGPCDSLSNLLLNKFSEVASLKETIIILILVHGVRSTKGDEGEDNRE
jgi:hypothetical protein